MIRILFWIGMIGLNDLGSCFNHLHNFFKCNSSFLGQDLVFFRIPFEKHYINSKTLGRQCQRLQGSLVLLYIFNYFAKIRGQTLGPRMDTNCLPNEPLLRRNHAFSVVVSWGRRIFVNNLFLILLRQSYSRRLVKIRGQTFWPTNGHEFSRMKEHCFAVADRDGFIRADSWAASRENSGEYTVMRGNGSRDM